MMGDLEEIGDYAGSYVTHTQPTVSYSQEYYAAHVSSCVFCDIGMFKNVESGKIIVDLPSVYIMEPLNPVVEGHVLVVPRRHVPDAATDPDLAGMVMRVASAYSQRPEVGSCNIITSIGKEATQSVFHLHLHVVPRREGDGLKLPWSEQPVYELDYGEEWKP
jgi:histidine triad (HIT) family protein